MQAEIFLKRSLAVLSSFRWLSFASLSFALLAQYLFEPPSHLAAAVTFYIVAIGFLIWAGLNGEWGISSPKQDDLPFEAKPIRKLPLILSLPLLVSAFYLFAGNRFTLLNLSLWVAGVLLFFASLWVTDFHLPSLKNMDWEWIALLSVVFLLIAFFRFYRLDQIPAEPFSDHAEKILDVYDVSLGKTSIFFERNTGREAIQMYWTWLISKIFGTGFSFLSLKMGTALIGLFTLPFVYYLGKEFGNPLVGFFALLLFGIAYWPNVISRIGLRFPLYPFFAAATLLYLTRSLRTLSRNDFLLCGLFLGLGLHGYTPFRVMPFVVLMSIFIFLFHAKTKEIRKQAWTGLGVVISTSFILFLPLLRYWIEHPDTFSFRAFSRLGAAGTELTDSLWVVFTKNFFRGVLMFNVNDGNIWVNSIPFRPALDVVTGALFVIGVLLLVVNYFRQKDWRDLVLLISIPLLLMPSILSLAFPLENPALNRAGGAAVVAILVSARALEGWLAGAGVDRRRQYVAYAVTAVLLSVSMFQNYNLVFRTFDASFRRAVWNSSEMGAVIKAHDNVQTAWIVPYAQWVDTRLPAIWMGEVTRDFALPANELFRTTLVAGSKLFIFKPEDMETEIFLKQLYPNGRLSRYTSAFVGKDFMIFTVEK
ncbi:MAG: glycosyltransferase family 39 protein [Anaerolineales bacterium]